LFIVVWIAMEDRKEKKESEAEEAARRRDRVSFEFEG